MTPQQERRLHAIEQYQDACLSGHQKFSERSGHPVCRTCGRGYGSTLDGICTPCRGCTAWDVIQAIKKEAA